MVILLAVLDDSLEDDEEEESALLSTPSLTKITLFCKAHLFHKTEVTNLRLATNLKYAPRAPSLGWADSYYRFDMSVTPPCRILGGGLAAVD